MLKRNRADKPVFRPMSNERNVRARRAEDTVVKAETLIVSESLKPNSSTDNQQKRSIAVNELNDEMTLCLNKSTSTLLILSLAVLSSFSLATGFYISYDVCSTRYHHINRLLTL